MSTETAPRQDHAVRPAKPQATQRLRRFSLLTGRLRPAVAAAPVPSPNRPTRWSCSRPREASSRQPAPGRGSRWRLRSPRWRLPPRSARGYIVWHLRNAAPPTTARLASRRDLTVRGAHRRAASGHSPIDLNFQAGRHDLELRHGTMSRRESVDDKRVSRPSTPSTSAPLPPALGAKRRRRSRADQWTLGRTCQRRRPREGRRRWSSPIHTRRARRRPHERLDQRPSSGPAGRRSDGGCGQPAVPTAAPAHQQPGWVRVESNIPLDVHEEDRLIGTSAIDRIMLPAGSYALRLVSRPLNFEGKQTVQITGGQMKVVNPIRRTAHSASTRSWAEVLVNGERKGETPLGNPSVPIGQHEVVFRHPQFGEQPLRDGHDRRDHTRGRGSAAMTGVRELMVNGAGRPRCVSRGGTDADGERPRALRGGVCEDALSALATVNGSDPATAIEAEQHARSVSRPLAGRGRRASVRRIVEQDPLYAPAEAEVTPKIGTDLRRDAARSVAGGGSQEFAEACALRAERTRGGGRAARAASSASRRPGRERGRWIRGPAPGG